MWWLLMGCASVLEDRTPYVSDPRVLAVRAEPAEVEAGDEVALTALFADGSGELSTAPVDWSFCLSPKPLAELGPVAPVCLEPGSEALASIGEGRSVAGVVPTDACSLFGPNPPPPREGEPAGRPADPDVTGGYYQPVVGFVDEADPVLSSVRIRCGIANVSQETYIAWNQGYRSNEAPVPAALEVDGALADGVITVSAGAALTLAVSWPECPTVGVCGDGVCSHDESQPGCPEDCTEPRGCAGAETYVVFDGEALLTRREGISVTWFTTGGSLAEARTGRAGDDLQRSSENVWTAPEAGAAWLGVVLRDERGGVEFAGWEVVVE